jgi:DNA polymerase V
VEKSMARGGIRAGAGRPTGTGKFGVPTTAVRVPTHRLDEVARFMGHEPILLYASCVKAGFPSPAEDYAEQHLDLNTHLIQRPAATFFLKVSGDSMINAGIFDGDLLIVDRSIEAAHGKIVIAAINGELTVKRLQKTAEGVFLVAENNDYPPIALQPSDQLQLWGVVTYAIHALASK